MRLESVWKCVRGIGPFPLDATEAMLDSDVKGHTVPLEEPDRGRAVSNGPITHSYPVDGARLYRLTLNQYQQMSDAGILDEASDVTLIEGVLVKKRDKHQPHIIASQLVERFLHRALPAGWTVSSQNPVRLDASGSEPEPDYQVVRGHPRDYLGRRVTAADVAVVIEIADASVREDHGVMKRIYAQAAIPVYWVVDLPAMRVTVYSDPTGPDAEPDYRRRVDFEADAEIGLVVEGQDLARIVTRELLP